MRFPERVLIFILSIIFALSLLAGCSNELRFNKKTPVEKRYSSISFNEDIKLERVKRTRNSSEKSIDFGDNIVFDLINLSEHKVQFPPDWGLYIYILDNNGNWLEVDNSVNYVGKDPLVLLPKSAPDYLPGIFRVVLDKPNDIKLDKKVPVKIVILGRIIEDGGDADNRVGAFFSLILNK